VLTNPSKTKEQTRQKLEEAEIQKVNKDPDKVGINIDQDYIVDGSYTKGIKFIKTEWPIRYGTDAKNKIEIAEKEGTIQVELDKRVNEQHTKLDKLKNYLSRFPRLEHVRINPYGVESPINPNQAIEIQPDETRRVTINSDFQEQLRLIVDKCPDTILVVPFYNSRKGPEYCSDIPSNDQEIADYITICDTLLIQFGNKLQLEIGNETNVDRKTGEMFTNKQFASHTNPHEYAQFYIKVANELKKKHPNARLAMAGIACYDAFYLKTVLEDVKEYENHNNLDKLINTVSIHPYRQNPEKGAIEVKEGKFPENPTETTYNQQMEEFLGISRNYNPDVNTTIGEIGFSLTDVQNQQKLERSIELSKQKGLTSFIYPAVNV